MCLFPDDAGEINFGTFYEPGIAPTELLANSPRVQLRAVREVHVHVVDDASEMPAEVRSLAVVVGDRRIELAPDAMDALPQVPDPSRPDKQGWRVRDLLASAVGRKKVAGVRLVTGAGESVDAPARALSSSSSSDLVWLRRNRRGRYRFYWWKRKGETFALHKDLRDVRELRVRSR